MIPEVAPYWALIEAFTEGRLHPDEFEALYLRLFTNDPTKWPQEFYEVLNEMFFYVDAYWGGDPALLGPDTINGNQLRERAAEALTGLRRALAESGRVGD